MKEKIRFDELSPVGYENEQCECFYSAWEDSYYYRDKDSGNTFYFEEDELIPVEFIY